MNDYRYLREEFPEVISGEQLRQIADLYELMVLSEIKYWINGYLALFRW